MTRRFLNWCALLLTSWLMTPGVWGANPTNAAPDFKEVYDLLRRNLPGATEASLNQAAVAGLVSQFPGKVALLGSTAAEAAVPPGQNALSKSGIIESNVAFLRVSRVVAGLAAELAAAGGELAASNKIAGTILDLRFASGEDYAAAKEAASRLADRKAARSLFAPLVVLVNGQTRGAAEALVAELREADAGLMIGSRTAGEVMSFKEFPLRDGERLLIATAPMKVDDKTMSSEGLKPDIAVAVNADDERAFWQNPYRALASDTNAVAVSTNSFLPIVDRTSEADLVRQQQRNLRRIDLLNLPRPVGPLREPVQSSGVDTTNEDDSASPRAVEPPKLVLGDPVLVRAVDLVKGLAIVRGSRP